MTARAVAAVTAAAGILLAGCSATSSAPLPQAGETDSAVVASATASPTASPTESAVSAPPASAMIASLLPAPLNAPVQARLSTPVTTVDSDTTTGWYAVLATAPQHVDAVIRALAAQLQAAGYQVQADTPGQASGILYAAPSVPATPSLAASSGTDSPAPSATGGANVDGPPVFSAPSPSSSPVVGGLQRTPAPPAATASSWVEVRAVSSNAGYDVPRSPESFIAVSVLSRK